MKSKGYKVTGKWNSLPMYGCSKCGFTTMKEDKMEQHMLVHVKYESPPAEKKEPAKDRFGVPVRESVETPMKKGS